MMFSEKRIKYLEKRLWKLESDVSTLQRETKSLSVKETRCVCTPLGWADNYPIARVSISEVVDLILKYLGLELSKPPIKDMVKLVKKEGSPDA